MKSLLHSVSWSSPYVFSWSLSFRFLSVCFFIFMFLATLHSMWHLNSLNRDWTHAPCIGRQSLTTGPPGKSLYSSLPDGQDLKEKGAREWSQDENPRVWLSHLAFAHTMRGISGYHTGTTPFTKSQVHLYGHTPPNFSINCTRFFHYIPFLLFHNLSETDRNCKSVVGKVNLSALTHGL